APTAGEDLRELLEKCRTDLQSVRTRDPEATQPQESPARPLGALLFTCNGRGTRMFERPRHDAGLLRQVLGDIPVAGFFAAGEIAPVAGRQLVHSCTARRA